VWVLKKFKKFEEPELIITKLDVEDIITTSLPYTGEDDLGWI